MNGSRSAATTGGRTAFRIAIERRGDERACEALDRDAGNHAAAKSSATAERIQLTRIRTGRMRRRSGSVVSIGTPRRSSQTPPSGRITRTG